MVDTIALAGEIYTKEPGGQDSCKTHTALLLDKEGNFKAFGSRALGAYFQNNCDGQDLLFENFKMGLHGNEGSLAPQAAALNGAK
jgi:hypothetical protein